MHFVEVLQHNKREQSPYHQLYATLVTGERPQLAQCLAGAPHLDPVTTEEVLEPAVLALPGEGGFSLSKFRSLPQFHAYSRDLLLMWPPSPT